MECQIKESDLTLAEFTSSTFKNCEFLKSNLIASTFMDFEFKETIFKNSHLDLIGARSIKVWKLNQCTEIKEPSNFGNLLENMSYDG